MTRLNRLIRSPRAWIVAGVFAFASLSQALPLLLVPAAVEVLTGVMTMKNFVLASLGAHAAVALLWGNKDGSSSPAASSSGSQITVYIDPKKALIAPAGWTASADGTSNAGSNPQPTPPSSQAAQSTWVGNTSTGAEIRNTSASAFAETWSRERAESSNTRFVSVITAEPFPADPSSLKVRYAFKRAASTGDETVYEAGDYNAAQLSMACPAGYSPSGSTCVLTNQSVVLKPLDQNCVIVRSGNTFGTDPLDPDCSTMAATMPVPSTIQLKKNNEILEATINADGSVTTKMTGPDSNGNTETTIINFAPPSGTMGMPATGQSNTTTSGSGDLNNPNNTVPKLEMPTDYNREATQQAVNTKLDQINDSLNPTAAGPDTSLTTQTNDYNAKATAHKGLFDGIGSKGQSNEGGIFGWSWFPTIPTATCAPLNFGTSQYMTTLNLCPTLDLVRDLAGYALYLSTAWALLGILTGKQGA